MDSTMNEGIRIAPDEEVVCRGYRDCLVLIDRGEFDKAAEIIAEVWPIDSRYAKALEDKLEVARRWQRAKADDAERKRFWEWMDSRR